MTLRALHQEKEFRKDRTMFWWIIDMIADGDFEALGAVVALGALLGWLAIR
jgi:hypothetical protein